MANMDRSDWLVVVLALSLLSFLGGAGRAIVNEALADDMVCYQVFPSEREGRVVMVRIECP